MSERQPISLRLINLIERGYPLRLKGQENPQTLSKIDYQLRYDR